MRYACSLCSRTARNVHAYAAPRRAFYGHLHAHIRAKQRPLAQVSYAQDKPLQAPSRRAYGSARIGLSGQNRASEHMHRRCVSERTNDAYKCKQHTHWGPNAPRRPFFQGAISRGISVYIPQVFALRRVNCGAGSFWGQRDLRGSHFSAPRDPFGQQLRPLLAPRSFARRACYGPSISELGVLK